MSGTSHLVSPQVKENARPGCVEVLTSTPKKIANITFGMLSPEEMRRLSHLQIVNRELYNMPARKPVPHGVLDPRLGISDKKSTCATCGLKLADCVGHWGYVKLELPVFHIGYIKAIIEVLQRICKTCARILLPEEEIDAYLRKFRDPNLEVLKRKALAKKILNQCKKATYCPHCGAANGAIKKIGGIKIVHEKYKVKGNDEEAAEFMGQFEEASQYNKEIKAYLPRAQEDISPLRARMLFRRIPNEDVELFDMDADHGRPELFILTQILVPPVCIRPSIPSDSSAGSNEDDLTMKLTEIIMTNNTIKHSVEKGVQIQAIMEAWDYLQLLCAMYINSEVPGFPASMHMSTGKPGRSLCQRLKGKQGRFRGNLSGKRVDFSGRTVISPDPNLRINQVGVPELMAKILTYPERVCDHNIERLRKLVMNGPDKHPGANYVESPSTGMKTFLKFAKRAEVARNLKIGDIVERHLCDDDIVLFNRQPSLHKLSIMCHMVKVLPYRTLRFNECVCAPYNADFDGDEMNLHVPQTEEARAEALTLMGVYQNLVTPRHGVPMVSATQDFLTGAYLLSRKNTFFDRAQMSMLCFYMGLEDQKIDLPPPTIIKPIELWTGKQLFGLLIKPNEKTEVFVNFEAKNKNYSKGEHMCPNDGWVCFINSELISGILDKKILGDGSKDSLFYVLMRNYTPDYAAICMSRLAKVTSRWLMNQGFTIGIDDVTPSPKIVSQKEQLVRDGYAKCEEAIQQFIKGELPPQPGCDAEQTIESVLNGDLSKLREDAATICLRELHWRNAPLTMALCGSKGSNINISQMVACVGQQTVSGSRIQNGFINRTLPHFPLFSKAPAAKGFVKNSFYSGLTATEFFFHTMAGREGLVDTAVKTAETGYMQRRLMKALEDLSTQYDNTVRNSVGGIVQFHYGDDGLDPANMEADEGKPLNFGRLLTFVKNTTPCPDEQGLLPYEFNATLEAFLADKENAALFSGQFQSDLRKFVESYVDDLVDLRTRLKLPACRDGPEPSTMEQSATDMWTRVLENTNSTTATQFARFLEKCKYKYRRAMTDPGQAVGALGAQSIGEPGTQMTLKTFHFAGVASMNVTLGVPRIKEIINGAKNISTPIITATLVNDQDEKAARIVKARIEKTTLGEVSKYIKEVFAPGQCYLSVKVDLATIDALQLDLNINSIRNSILAAGIKNLKDQHIVIEKADRIRVYPTDTSKENMFHSLQMLRKQLPNVIIKGIPSVGRAVINKSKDKDTGREYLNLLVEGLNLRAVMGTPGVVGTKTKSNHVAEMEQTLGIEAARRTIMDEIQYTMKSHGMSIDSRHVMLLADVMSYKGEILGITRFGIAKMKDSVLMLASFERTTDHLFDAAVHGRRDDIVGVSECIIMGIPIPLGTGLFKLMSRVEKRKYTPKQPLFANNNNNNNTSSSSH